MTDKIEVCAILLNDAAIERSQGNPELASADFESLCNVMWPDDNDMKRDGINARRIPTGIAKRLDENGNAEVRPISLNFRGQLLRLPDRYYLRLQAAVF